MEPWEPTDDLTLIIRTLISINAKLDELGEQAIAIRRLLENDEEEEEED